MMRSIVGSALRSADVPGVFVAQEATIAARTAKAAAELNRLTGRVEKRGCIISFLGSPAERRAFKMWVKT
jgi:hypothetical protein